MTYKLPEPYSVVGSLLGSIGTFSATGFKLRRGDPLFTAEQMQAAYAAGLAAQVPEGWKMVPVEPNLKMVIAAENYIGRHAYEKMLAAAPEPTK